MKSSIWTGLALCVSIACCIPAHADAGAGKAYGAPDPTACPATPGTALPAPGTLAQLVQCGHEGGTGHDYYLLRDVKVQVGAPHTGVAGVSGDIDVNVPVYPIRGSFTEYQCDYSNAGSVGQNCNVYNAAHATGQCWRTSFGEWKCRMGDTQATDGPKHVGPPAK